MSAEDVLKTIVETIMEEEDDEELDENDGDALKRLKRMMEEEDEWRPFFVQKFFIVKKSAIFDNRFSLS